MTRARALVPLVLAASACTLDYFDPEVGGPVLPLCVEQDLDPDRDVSFRRDLLDGVFAAPATDCLACHSPEGATPFGLTLGGLDLSDYDGLMAGGVVGGADIVVPGRPCDSVLLQKVGEAPAFGGRMPLDGPPFLDDEQLALIHDWIAEGALDD